MKVTHMMSMQGLHEQQTAAHIGSLPFSGGSQVRMDTGPQVTGACYAPLIDVAGPQLNPMHVVRMGHVTTCMCLAHKATCCAHASTSFPAFG